MLLKFLPKLDVVIFLVTADAPLVASELELLEQIRKNDVRKLLFAMNKVDAVDAEELQEDLQHNRKVLENSELTLEQIEQQRSQLEEIRRNPERNRQEMERNFHSSWRASFDEFENALAPLRRQLVQQYTELVKNAPALASEPSKPQGIEQSPSESPDAMPQPIPEEKKAPDFKTLKDRKQIFASKCMLYLPTEEELRLKIQRERKLIEATHKEPHHS